MGPSTTGFRHDDQIDRHASNLSHLGLAWFVIGLSFVSLGAFQRQAVGSQQPLCPEPTATDTYFYVCRPDARPTVSKLLYDFTIDHLYRPPPPFERRVLGLFQSVGMSPFVDGDDPSIQSVLERRGRIEFTRIDESSGEFVNRGPHAETVSVERNYLGSAYKVDLALPETIQGLYWRSPIELELMFYKAHGVHLRLTSGKNEPFDQDIVCLSVTPQRTRVVTADPGRRHLVILYEDCP